MDIKLLCSDCENCIKLKEMAKQAAKELGIVAKIAKVTDIQEIIKYTLSTPGLVVDGKLRHHGKPLPDLERVKELLLTQG
jgi:small redox-active disulfide protein 2